MTPLAPTKRVPAPKVTFNGRYIYVRLIDKSTTEGVFPLGGVLSSDRSHRSQVPPALGFYLATAKQETNRFTVRVYFQNGAFLLRQSDRFKDGTARFEFLRAQTEIQFVVHRIDPTVHVQQCTAMYSNGNSLFFMHCYKNYLCTCTMHMLLRKFSFLASAVRKLLSFPCTVRKSFYFPYAAR